MLYCKHNFDIRKSYYSNQSGFNSVDEVLQCSLYTDVALFFFPFFSKTSASEASVREQARSARRKNKERLFSSSPTPTPLRWRSINPLRLVFYNARSTDFEKKLEGL